MIGSRRLRNPGCAWILAGLVALLFTGPRARADEDSTAYAPPAGAVSPLQFHGYVDLGFAKAQGNGTSFAPNDLRVPADYGVDTFATAVDSRGDVASINSNGLPTNGFLPHSLNIGGNASPFIATVDLDVAYAPEGAWYMGFIRLQFMPRVNAAQQEADQFLVEQAFVRIVPFNSAEFALTVGKFDGVFNIEYLDNEAPVRTNITPSLIARYTTGQQLGAKAFYRIQVPALWSAVSLNVALSSNPPVVDALDPSALSLSGAPVFTGRFGYELNAPKFELKLGASASTGPRGDQDNATVVQQELGGDARIIVSWLSVSSEFVHIMEQEGGSGKVGSGGLISPFMVNGYNATVAIGIPIPSTIIRRVSPYVQYSQRFGGFTGFAWLDTCRITPGLRLDFADVAALKAEYLRNIEIAGAPTVANDVMTSSLVFYF
jgi:hypothetical protein